MTDKCWDYIVVGAGSAGCVLANRLSADPRNQVLLVEAGGSDRSPLQRIPMAGVLLNYGDVQRDWRFQTERDPSRNNRTEIWPRGKLLGGTSSLNGMIYVRGAQEDFDAWSALGNSGWSYQDVAPLFRRLESYEFARSENPGLYGSDGPLKVRQLKGVNLLSKVFVAAWGELGVHENEHYNTGTQSGACILSASHSGRIRYSSSQAFLQPVKYRRNLRVLTHTLVTQVLFEGNRAIGIATAKGHPPHEGKHRAAQVILCGGAVNSPQLLLLSGIGPAQHLREMGIGVRHSLPGVGQNLQDHPNCSVTARVNVPTVTADVKSAIKDGINWLLFARGSWTSAGCQALAFVKTTADLPQPDVQVHIMPFGMTKDDKNRVRFLEKQITLLPNVSRAASRGEIKLHSSNPYDPPAIYPNMLGDDRDLKTLVAAGRLCRRLLKTQAFLPYVDEEMAPGSRVNNDLEWEAFVRETSASGAHQVGTCKMGIDSMAVVDPTLKVHGIEGLKVADASIMPTIPSGNTNASCMMIAEKCAELILIESRSRE